MTRLVASQTHRLLGRSASPHLVMGEIPAAQGIVDVVAVRFDPDAIRRRLDAGVGPLCSPLRIRTLDLLRVDRGMKIETLARKVGSNPRALTRSTLGPLHENGFISVADGMVRSTGIWRPAGSQLTAVELKLSKWRDALRQADNFALSADRTWVVMDEARSSAAVASAAHFRLAGVGLALLGSNGRLRLVVKPSGRRPLRWLRALMAEQVWAEAQAEVAELAA